MSHLEHIRDDAAYAEFLANWEEGFYAKYADTLGETRSCARVLDVGCGVGQVIRRLTQAGLEAHGVDVSMPNIERAQRVSHLCQYYDGRTLPFADRHFAAVGALNVLEHVEEPEDLIAEMVRVTERGGRVIISSPNFFRVIGFRDYHPRMRGLGNKWSNWRRLRAKRRQMRTEPAAVRFDRLTPIIKEPFTPDDDAIVATNAFEIQFFLKQNGCKIITAACTDRYVARPLDWLLNLTPLRFFMLNAFVIARRVP